MTYFSTVLAWCLAHPTAPALLAIMLACTAINLLRAALSRQTVGAWVASHQSSPVIGGFLRFSSGIGLDPADIVVGFLDMLGTLFGALAKSRGLPVPSDPPTASVTTTDTHTVEVQLPKPAPLPREDS